MYNNEIEYEAPVLLSIEEVFPILDCLMMTKQNKLEIKKILIEICEEDEMIFVEHDSEKYDEFLEKFSLLIIGLNLEATKT